MAASNGLCGTVMYNAWFQPVAKAQLEALTRSLGSIDGVTQVNLHVLGDATLISVGLTVTRTLDRLVDLVDCLVWGWSQMYNVKLLPRQS